MTDPVAGWYRDPGDDRNHRWWDGRQWTTTTRPAGDAAIASPTVTPGPVPAPGGAMPTTPSAPWATPGASPPTPAPRWPPALGGTPLAAPRPEPVPRRRADHVDPRLAVGLVVIGLAVIVALAVVVVGSDHRSSRADQTVGTSAAGAGQTLPANRPSSSVPPRTPTTPPSAQVVQAGQQYLSAVAVLNQAQHVFAAGVAALPQVPTDAQVAALAAPYAQALGDFDQALLDLSLPAAIQSDRDNLVASNGVLRDDLQAVGDLGVGSLGDWSDQFTYDQRESTRDAAHLRADLHLPPNPAGMGTTI
jgi:hypothetical protein